MPNIPKKVTKHVHFNESEIALVDKNKNPNSKFNQRRKRKLQKQRLFNQAWKKTRIVEKNGSVVPELPNYQLRDKSTDELLKLSNIHLSTKYTNYSNLSKLNQNKNLVVGISKAEMDKHARMQQQTKFYWIACVEVISSFYGIKISQKDILNIAESRSLGSIAKFIVGGYNQLNHKNVKSSNTPLSIYTIRKIFENNNIKVDVQRYNFNNHINDIKKIVHELSNNRLVMMSYKMQNSNSNGAVITGIVTNIDKTEIIKLFIRKSSKKSFENNNNGKKAYESEELKNILPKISSLTFIKRLK
ncbi:MAG: hypothetical protein RLZZ210_652 [Pseudomonadota bacterium]|jgi:hypothetical protein